MKRVVLIALTGCAGSTPTVEPLDPYEAQRIMYRENLELNGEDENTDGHHVRTALDECDPKVPVLKTRHHYICSDMTISKTCSVETHPRGRMIGCCSCHGGVMIGHRFGEFAVNAH